MLIAWWMTGSFMMGTQLSIIINGGSTGIYVLYDMAWEKYVNKKEV